MIMSYHCRACDPGTYADSTGSSICNACGAGRYSTFTSTTTAARIGSAEGCTDCDVGKYASGAVNKLNKCPSHCITVQGLVACILKFQGVKRSQSGAATAHSHGHMSLGMDDLTDCTSRIQATVASCRKRVGVEAA